MRCLTASSGVAGLGLRERALAATRAGVRASLTVVMAFGAAGCMAVSAARVPRPGADGRFVPNHVFVPDPVWDDQSVGLPSSALTSEASLYSLNDNQVCFDVLVRSWSGSNGNWRVGLAINGRDVAASGWMPFACKPEDSCLPNDSSVRLLVSDTDPLVSARGSRLCFNHIRVPAYRAKRIALSATQGGYTLTFRWRLEPRSSTRLIGAD